MPLSYQYKHSCFMEMVLYLEGSDSVFRIDVTDMLAHTPMCLCFELDSIDATRKITQTQSNADGQTNRRHLNKSVFIVPNSTVAYLPLLR